MISVIMPVYNNINFLKTSIDSILSQTYQNFEIIVIDDCSTEPVWDILDLYKNDRRFVFRKNETNMSSPKTLNKALSLAQGDIIARQDSDDISLPARFEEEIKLMQDDIGVVSCYGQAIDMKGERIDNKNIDKVLRIDAPQIKENMRSHSCNYLLGPAAIFSRKVFEKIGFYDEAIGCGAEDTNYWYRAFNFFDLGIVPKELFQYRINSKSMRLTQCDQFGDGPSGKLKRREWIFERAKHHVVIKDI